MVPRILRKKYSRDWWHSEMQAVLSRLRPLNLPPPSLERIVLSTIGAEVISGSQQFLCRRMEFDKPGISQLHDVEVDDRMWIMINPRGLHLCDYYTKTRCVQACERTSGMRCWFGAAQPTL